MRGSHSAVAPAILVVATAIAAIIPMEPMQAVRVPVQTTQLSVHVDGDLTQLAPTDFEVIVDGKPRAVTEIVKREPIFGVLALDMSGSMTLAFPLTPFMGAVEKLAAALRPAEHVRFMGFGDTVERGPERELSDQATLDFIRTLKQQNGTRLFDALDSAVSSLELRSGTRLLAVLSDGNAGNSRTPASRVRERSIAGDVQIHAILVDMKVPALGLSSSRFDAELRRMIEETGGTASRLKSVDDISSALQSLLADVRQQVVLRIDVSDLKPRTYSAKVRSLRAPMTIRAASAVAVR